jgi:hypothetical protein
MAIARKMLLIIRRILMGETKYREPIPQSVCEKVRQRAVQKCVKDLQQIGHEVHLFPLPIAG